MLALGFWFALMSFLISAVQAHPLDPAIVLDVSNNMVQPGQITREGAQSAAHELDPEDQVPGKSAIETQAGAGRNVLVPAYPPMAVRGGNVVAVIEFLKGAASQVVLLYGDEPFIEPTRTALAQWQAITDKPALVIVNFRDPFISLINSGQGIKLEPRSYTIKANRYAPGMPVPKLVVDPLYSDASLVVTGAGVLRLEVTPSGSVGSVEVIQALGEYTQTMVEAAKKWEFIPAINETGEPAASNAFAVCIYRPAISKAK